VTVVALVLGAAITAALFFGAVLGGLSPRHGRFLPAPGQAVPDALIQRDVPELVRTSAFARSETMLQMAGVLGGAIGIVMPLNGALGFTSPPESCLAG